MRKLFLIFAITLVSTSAFADMGTQKYRGALTKCDADQDSRLNTTVSTNDIKRTVLDASNCYVRVGTDVIRNYYSDTYEDTARAFIAYANAIYAASLNAYSGPDECYPECGQMSEVMRMDMTESYIKRYIIDMLDYVDTLDV